MDSKPDDYSQNLSITENTTDNKVEEDEQIKKQEQESYIALLEVNLIISIILSNPSKDISFLVSGARALIERFNLKNMLAKLDEAIQKHEDANKLANNERSNDANQSKEIKSIEDIKILFEDEEVLKKYREQRIITSLFNIATQDENTHESADAMRCLVNKRNQAGGIKGLFEEVGKLLSSMTTEMKIIDKKINEIKEHKAKHGSSHPEEKTLNSLENRLETVKEAKNLIREECKNNLVNFVKLEHVLQTIDKPFNKLSDEEVHKSRHAYINFSISNINNIDQKLAKAEQSMITDQDIEDILGINNKELKNEKPSNYWQNIVRKSQQNTQRNFNPL